MKNRIEHTVKFIIPIFHTILLLVGFFENIKTGLVLSIFYFVLLALFYKFEKQTDLSPKSSRVEFFFNYFLFLISSLATFLIHHFTSLNSIFAASFIGVLIGASEYIGLKKIYQAIGYTGVFCGMSFSLKVSNSFIEYTLPNAMLVFTIASFFGAVVFEQLKPCYNGIGGKLGSIAFIASFLSILLVSFLWNIF